MSLLDQIAAVVAAAVGFFFALALVLVLELLSGELWVVGVGLLILIAGIVLYETVTDWLLGGLARKLFRIPESEAEAQERRSATIARYSAAVGVVLAFLATRVWSAETILGVF